jgi:(E)-2-((N-methylformamido)methylene)succinate hydrolase
MPIVALPSGIKINHELHGSAGKTPLVLVHGHGSRGATFETIIPFLCDDFFILTFDLRGHGESGKPLGSTYEETLPLYTIEQFAQDLHDLITVISFPTPFVLAGHSMGGMIAQIFALEHASLVSHLVLCGTAPDFYTDGRAGMLALFKDGSIVLDEKFYRSSVPIGLTRAYRKAHPAAITASIESRLLVPGDVYIASMENIIFHFNVRDQLEQLKIPTLIMVGDQDAMVEPDKSRILHELISTSTLVTIPGQNHGIFHEIPDIVAGHIIKFMQGVR